MKKILIPAVLTATIMIAGMFAIVDVDRVMAGHLPNIGTITSASIGTGVITSDDIGKVIVDADVVANALTGAVLANTLTVDTINDESGGALTVSGVAALTLLGGTASSLKTTIGVLTIESIAAANLELDADDDGVGIILLGEGTDADADISDVIRIGVNAETTIQKTAANTLTIVATDLVLSTGVIGTTEIGDDTITSAKLVGSDQLTGAIRLQDKDTPGSLTSLTATFNPAVTSQAIVTCTVQITEGGSGAIADATILLAKTTGDGTVIGSTTATGIDDIPISETREFTTTIFYTGETTGGNNASFTCTIGGTVDASEVTENVVTVLWFPE